MECAAGAAAFHRPGRAIRLPGRRVQHIGVLRIHRQVDRAAAVVAIEHLLPGLAAILRAIHASIRVWPIRMPEHRRIDEIRIGRVHTNLADHFGVAKADVRPRLAGIGGLVNAVALNDVAAEARLPHADVDDVRVRGRDCQRAHRGGAEVVVADGRPGQAVVGGLPHAAADCAKVVLVRSRRAACHGNRTAATVRADASPPHARIQARVHTRRQRGLCLSRSGSRCWRLRADHRRESR